MVGFHVYRTSTQRVKLISLARVRARAVRTYAYIIINAHARTETEAREQNETGRKYKRDRTGQRTPVKRHGTARKRQLFLMGTVCLSE